MLKVLTISMFAIFLKFMGCCGAGSACTVYHYAGIQMDYPWKNCSNFKVPSYSDQYFYEQFIQDLVNGGISKGCACANQFDMTYVNLRTTFLSNLPDAQRKSCNPYYLMSDMKFWGCIEKPQTISDMDVATYFMARITFFQELLSVSNEPHLNSERSVPATVPAILE